MFQGKMKLNSCEIRVRLVARLQLFQLSGKESQFMPNSECASWTTKCEHKSRKCVVQKNKAPMQEKEDPKEMLETLLYLGVLILLNEAY